MDIFQEPIVTVIGRNLAIKTPFSLKNQIEAIPGRSWNRKLRVWEVPANQESIRYIKAIAPNAQINPKVYDLLRQIGDKKTKIETQKDIPWQKQTPILPMPLTVKPFQHQIAAYNVVGTIFGIWDDTPSTDSGAGLYMEQGTGKTLVTVAVAGRMLLDDIISKMLVVAPSSVVPVWKKEFDDFADFSYEVIALDGDSKKRMAAIDNWSQQ